jgi:uncharacterized protein DUF6941
MHVSFALFADGANISQEGKLNILGVFDAVQVGGVPTVHPRATLVVRLKGSHDDIGTHVIGLRWVNPKGDELWSSMGQLEIAAPTVSVGDLDFPIIASVDLPLDQLGGYRMEIALNNEPKAAIELQVRAGTQILPTTSPMLS